MVDCSVDCYCYCYCWDILGSGDDNSGDNSSYKDEWSSLFELITSYQLEE